VWCSDRQRFQAPSHLPTGIDVAKPDPAAQWQWLAGPLTLLTKALNSIFIFLKRTWNANSHLLHLDHDTSPFGLVREERKRTGHLRARQELPHRTKEKKDNTHTAAA